MDIKNKFFWFVGVSTVITLMSLSAIAGLFWNHLPPDQKIFLLAILKQHFIYLFGGSLLLIGIIVFLMDGIFHTYIIPIGKLTEETLLINTVNPSHRIRLEAGREIARLARIINEGADRYETLKREVDERITRATAETETEKNIMAAIMAELPEGVFICNAAGQIILYNNRVKQMFGTGSSRDGEGSTSGKFIGLGRSIFGVIDRNCIVYALDEISEKLQRDAENIAAYFVIAGKEKNFLRVETVPVLDHQRQFTGFILILYDITEELEKENRTGQVLHSMTTGIRHSSAGIRSAVEAILDYPQMDRSQLDRFVRIIHTESLNIGQIIHHEETLFANRRHTRWPLVRARVDTVLESLVKKAMEKLAISIDFSGAQENIWIKVCSYSFFFAMLSVIQRLAEETGCRQLACRTRQKDRFIAIEFKWNGIPVKLDRLRRWEGETLEFENDRMPITLKEVMGYHDAQLWSHTEKEDTGISCLSLFLPQIDVKEPGIIRKVAILPRSRPEFYDFDLFNQPGQVPELDNRLLTELSYTVFDTETTGLNPAGGDEIISIGAVRIVNGRLLREDFFDQIIDPRRDIPAESIRFHGIQPEMLEGQPTIEKVLPDFHEFAEDTILVAHNAAFDMRMLQVKEAATGVAFINPVLDTMLLSAVVHPSQDDHNLESIAQRLGLRIMGRHTALGDALVTGEIFLKLVRLLLEKNIRTLKEARMASQNTYYARLKY